MTDVPAIDGVCDARFARVRDAFAENFRSRGELGASVALTVDGVPVVDLWGGFADDAGLRPWRRDTIVNVFSLGKAMATLAALVLVERGELELDAPVARWWPEFASAGKDGVTVRMLLAHRAGVPGVRTPLPPLAMYEWDVMTAALAAEAPWWEPGRRHGYHVNTYGFLVGELVRRVSGTTIGDFFRHTIAGPLDADFRFGTGPEHDARIAEYVFGDDSGRIMDSDDDERRAWLRVIYLNPPGVSGLGTVNTREWRAAEMPSTNGHGNARAVARIYTALAGGGADGGVRLLRPDTIAQATAEHAAGPDAVVPRATRFGLGFQLTSPETPLGPNAGTFGHFGAGGSLGFADPTARLAFGYTMNRGGPRWQNPRVRALIDAVYAAVAG